MRLELCDRQSSQSMFLHVVEGRRVDDIVLVAGPEQLQEILAAFGERRGEEGEVVIADLGGDCRFRLMPDSDSDLKPDGIPI